MLSDQEIADLIDRPLYSDMVGVPSDHAPAAMLSRKTPWLPHRFGFVGSRAGYDHLRFECETLILDPQLAPALIAAGMLDAIIVEGASDEVSGQWQNGFFDYDRHGGQAARLLEAAAEHGVPVIAYLNGPAGGVPLFLPLARAATHVVVTSAGVRRMLADHGITAHLVPAPVQTALYNGFAPSGAAPASPAAPILSCDMRRAATDAETLALMRSLTPFGLRLCAADEHFQALSLPSLGDLAQAAEGTVTHAQLEALLVEHGIVVQTGPAQDGAAWQLGLNAAAARCSVLVLGAPDEDDPRRGIATFCPDPSALRACISRLVMRPIQTEKERQRSWRRAHRQHGAHHLARRIAELCGLDCPKALPTASVVTPTLRPEALPAVLENFRSQTWADKALIIVANTDTPELWDQSLLATDGSEQILFLSRDHSAGMALNLGAGRASGDYVMRMDDDDYYGPAYVEDMMLGAAAIGPDLMGKPPVFFYFSDEKRFTYNVMRRLQPSLHESGQIGAPDVAIMSGYTHTIRRSLLDEIGFSTRSRYAADAGLLDGARNHGRLLCAVADAMNAVIVRRSDPASHTWRRAPDSHDPAFSLMPFTPAEFLSPD